MKEGNKDRTSDNTLFKARYNNKQTRLRCRFKTQNSPLCEFDCDYAIYFYTAVFHLFLFAVIT